MALYLSARSKGYLEAYSQSFVCGRIHFEGQFRITEFNDCEATNSDWVCPNHKKYHSEEQRFTTEKTRWFNKAKRVEYWLKTFTGSFQDYNKTVDALMQDIQRRMDDRTPMEV